MLHVFQLGRIMTFLIIVPRKYFYLLTYTDEFLVDKYLWQFYWKTRANHVV